MRLRQVGVRAAVTVYAVSGVTLVCNDWWLKGAGLLPGWLTGKLSDLAGLIVAIVTAALVLGHRRTRTSLAACISIASVFALVKLSPSAAQLFLAALSSAGLKWRLAWSPLLGPQRGPWQRECSGSAWGDSSCAHRPSLPLWRVWLLANRIAS